MSTITLSAYEIGIRPLRDKEGRENLNDFSNGNDFYIFLRDYIANLQADSEEELELIDNERLKKVLRLSPNTLSPFGRQISGVFEAGDYGYESEIIDVDSGESVHKKSSNQAEMIPFYFHVFIPENGQKGILLLQRFQQYGIYGIFSETIASAFSERFEGFRLAMKPLVSDEIIDDFVSNGRLKKLTFKSLHLTPQIIQMADNGTNIPANLGRIEYSIVANRGQSLPLWDKIRRALRGREENVQGLFDINDFDYSNISVSVNLNGHTRTMDLSSLSKIGAFFDITNDVDINPQTSHPVLQSIREISNSIINDLHESLIPNEVIN